MRMALLKNVKVMLMFVPALLCGQETVAPTRDAPVGPAGGQDAGGYNVVQSWEFGYRFATIGGDQEKYRSDVNFGNGVRLLGSSLTVNSRDGRAKWFDELTLTTQGLGNDPYESAALRVGKNRLYEYDMTWRQNAYFNPGLVTAAGEHVMDTNYRWQDHDVTLLPQNWFRVHAGYSRVTQDGPALATQQEFDSTGDIFPVFRNVRDQYNEYRLGGDIRTHGLRLTILRRWEYFREDTLDSAAATQTGVLNPAPDASTVNRFNRTQPNKGQTPTWFGNLYFERKLITIDSRLTYAAGRGAFVQNELAAGLDRFGTAQNRQIAVSGTGNRPVTAGDLNITILPESRFNLVTGVSISNTRTNGSNLYEQFDNATLSFGTLDFQFLGIRLLTSSTVARYRFTRAFNMFAGFRYSDREVRSIEDVTSPGFPFSGGVAEQVNLLRAGSAGFNWTPLKNLWVHAEGEIGRTNNPFTPISLRNYQAIRSKVRYRKHSLSLGAGYEENYNNNSIVITAYSSRSRTYSAEGSWAPRRWISFDAAYSKLHLDTIGGVAFFAGPASAASLLSNLQSVYISNLHALNLNVKLSLGRRADLYLGYSLTKDTGDGRGTLAAQPDAVTQLLYNVQTYPLSYQTPLARVSWRLNERLRFNVGYQYYGYHEEFGLLGYNQGYRANTGYTSLLWSF
jgi:hypothetical protein